MKPSIYSLTRQGMQEWVLSRRKEIPCRPNLGVALP